MQPTRETFPDAENWNFVSEDFTPNETARFQRYRPLNESWGWPATRKQEVATFENRIHHTPENIYAITKYTDILFRAIANKTQGQRTMLAYDFADKLGWHKDPLNFSAAQKSAAQAFLTNYLDTGNNRALMTQLADEDVNPRRMSLYYAVTVLAARAILFLSVGNFDAACRMMKNHAYKLWTNYYDVQKEQEEQEEQDSPRATRKRSHSSSEGGGLKRLARRTPAKRTPPKQRRKNTSEKRKCTSKKTKRRHKRK